MVRPLIQYERGFFSPSGVNQRGGCERLPRARRAVVLGCARYGEVSAAGRTALFTRLATSVSQTHFSFSLSSSASSSPPFTWAARFLSGCIGCRRCLLALPALPRSAPFLADAEARLQLRGSRSQPASERRTRPSPATPVFPVGLGAPPRPAKSEEEERAAAASPVRGLWSGLVGSSSSLGSVVFWTSLSLAKATL